MRGRAEQLNTLSFKAWVLRFVRTFSWLPATLPRPQKNGLRQTADVRPGNPLSPLSLLPFSVCKRDCIYRKNSCMMEVWTRFPLVDGLEANFLGSYHEGAAFVQLL